MQFDVHTHKFDKSSNSLLNVNLELPEHGCFTAGIHPWSKNELSTSDLEQLERLANHPRCVAIGEIGLDKTKGLELEKQRQTFIAQLSIAEKYNLPVILHCVNYWNELDQLKSSLKPTSTWIIHGFSKAKLLEKVLKNGYFVSIGSQILTNRSLQQVIRQVPVDRLFLETDNAHHSIDEIYQKVAQLKGLELEVLENQLEINIRTIFTKWTIG
jgi:TatD DNase family protein